MRCFVPTALGITSAPSSVESDAEAVEAAEQLSEGGDEAGVAAAAPHVAARAEDTVAERPEQQLAMQLLCAPSAQRAEFSHNRGLAAYRGTMPVHTELVTCVLEVNTVFR